MLDSERRECRECRTRKYFAPGALILPNAQARAVNRVPNSSAVGVVCHTIMGGSQQDDCLQSGGADTSQPQQTATTALAGDPGPNSKSSF